MADGTNNIWIDSTFTTPSDGERDVDVEIFAGDSSNIGEYSMPVVFNVNTTASDSTNLNLEYFNEIYTVSGIINISHYYYVPTIPIYTSLINVGSEYNTGDTAVSGTDNIGTIYTTGFNSVSGTVDTRINIIVGLQMYAAESINTEYFRDTSLSGSLDYWANYTNFSGDYSLGLPVPYHTSFIDYDVYYNTGSVIKTPGWLNNIVDITFAGWVPYPFTADVFCATLGTMWNFSFETTAISGAVTPLNADVMLANQQLTDVLFDVYSTAIKQKYLDSDVEIRDGRLTRFIGDIYSTTQSTTGLAFNVDLYSLKIDNFSLAIDEYTAVSGAVYVDVLDDECPISVSGTYMFVAGQEVPISLEAIAGGYRLYYNPDDDFASLDGPTEFLVHAENECGDWLEEVFYLTLGVVVEYNNYEYSGIDFGFNNEVLVRVEAEDMATCPTLDSLAWSFTSSELRIKDLTASINGTPYGAETRDLSSTIRPKSTAYFYNKGFEVVLTAKDFAGNEMTPFVLNYKIEDKP